MASVKKKKWHEKLFMSKEEKTQAELEEQKRRQTAYKKAIEAYEADDFQSAADYLKSYFSISDVTDVNAYFMKGYLLIKGVYNTYSSDKECMMSAKAEFQRCLNDSELAEVAKSNIEAIDSGLERIEQQEKCAESLQEMQDSQKGSYPKCGEPNYGTCESSNCRNGIIPGYPTLPSHAEAEKDFSRLKIANAIFVDNNYTLNREFAQKFADYYRGAAFNVDFASETAVSEINNWADDNTNGLIKNLVDRFEPNTVMAIANAIYFSDKWIWRFNKEDTKENIFYTLDGNTTTNFMLREGEQPYFEDETIQATCLNFQLGGDLYYTTSEKRRRKCFTPESGFGTF
jgi:hypothetical protein